MTFQRLEGARVLDGQIRAQRLQRAMLIEPGSPEGQAIADQIVGPGASAARRAQLLGQLETFTDARVERYWQLLAIINGWPVPPTLVPGLTWLIAALRAGPNAGDASTGA